MSQYTPNFDKPYKISRSKIDLFIQCPRCFYLDQVKGIKRPSMPGFTLNSAVDHLLKKEFDLLRRQGQAHELMKKYGIKAIPFGHPEIDTWRNNFVGKQYHHVPTNLIIYGAVDDIWQSENGEGALHIVDYKSTSTQEEITLDGKYKQGYKRQMEIYQWIYRMSGFPVSDIGYFVFANAGKNKPKFDGILEFELTIHEHIGDTFWVEPVIYQLKECLESKTIPESGAECEYCAFNKKIRAT